MDWVNNCLAEAPQRVTAFFQGVTTFVSNLLGDQNEKREELPIIRNQADADLPNNQDVVLNVIETDAGVSAATSLLNQAPLRSQATITASNIEHPLSSSPVEEVLIDVNDAIRDQTDTGVSHTSPVSTDQAISAFNIESSRNLTQLERVISNDHAEIRDQTVVDMSDTTLLLPQTSIASQAATTGSHRQDPRSLPLEGAQNSAGVANAGSGVPSQHSREPPSSIVAYAIYIQALITEAKEVGNRVTILSVGGIFSELSGVIGNEDADLIHQYFFKAFILLCYASLASGLGLHGLIKLDPERIPSFAKIVKFTIYFSQGSLVYSVSCAICILFPSEVGVVVILIVPLVPIGLVAILSCARNDPRPSV